LVTAPSDLVDYRADGKLKDGTEVRIRPIRASDAPAIAAGFEHFGADSRHQRFFSAKTAVTAAELERLTHPELENAFRLVAEVRGGSEAGRLIGGASCVVDAETDPQRGEIAFSVIDPFQDKGLGTLLLRHLVALAHARGVTRFVASVMGDNKRMMAVFEKSGLPMEQREDRDAVRVTLSLS
jgi:RimJ/RimL family protein N-acetyltransferase